MMTTANYPLVLDPKETPAIWGGDALVKTYGKSADPAAKIGESWECWDENTVLNGPLAGRTVAALRASDGAALMGDIDASQIFPILTKIIDARDWLSVQVHPDDAYARRVEHQRNGKTECWYVLQAAGDAEIVLGWTQETNRDEYERRVKDGSLGDLLRRVPVRQGQAFYLPAGTLHAIGKGIVIFETQQASDLTYRIFDWNRLGADGKPRQLNVAKAADVLDYDRGTTGAVTPLTYTVDTLECTAYIADRRFTVDRIVAGNEPVSLSTGGRPVIVMSLGPGLEITANGVTAALRAYQTALLPAAVEWYTVASQGGPVAFVSVTPPRSLEAVAARMLAGGAVQHEIDAFMKQFAA